jgi:hypothetical protein
VDACTQHVADLVPWSHCESIVLNVHGRGALHLCAASAEGFYPLFHLIWLCCQRLCNEGTAPGERGGAPPLHNPMGFCLPSLASAAPLGLQFFTYCSLFVAAPGQAFPACSCGVLLLYVHVFSWPLT